MTRQANRVVVVAGATGDVGRAVTERFWRNGCALAIASRSQPRLEALCNELDLTGSRFAARAGDLGREPTAMEFVQNAKEVHGRIDIVVNAVGAWVAGSSDTPYDKTCEAFMANYHIAQSLMSAALPIMKRQGAGLFVNIASVLAVEPESRCGVYAASKAALVALSLASSKEYADFGVKVSVIAPGWIASRRAQERCTLPSERLLRPSDIAATIEYLASLSLSAHVEQLTLDCIADL